MAYEKGMALGFAGDEKGFLNTSNGFWSMLLLAIAFGGAENLEQNVSEGEKTFAEVRRMIEERKKEMEHE